MENVVDFVFKKAKKALSMEDIFALVSKKLERELTSEDRKLIIYIVNNKWDNRDIYKTPNNKFIALYKTSFFKGTFYRGRGENGVVVVNSSYVDKSGNYINKEDKYPVSKKYFNNAIEGDIVLIEKESVSNNKCEYIVREVLDRELKSIFGEVYREGANYFVKSIDTKKKNLIISVGKDAIEGSRVEARIDTLISDNYYNATIVRTFSHKDDPSEDILWEAFKNNVSDVFAEDSINEADNLPSIVLDSDRVGRCDLTNWEIFTIDGDDTKDFDDAISLEILPNGNYQLGVHIADVSHYVKEGMSLDKDAYTKGTSCYICNTVIPMLPHKLSNGICSLNPFVDRLCVSCVMEINKKGEVVSSNIWKSVINSKMRMTYSKVNDLLMKNVVDEDYIKYKDKLHMMNKLAGLLRNNRIKNGSIEFDTSELRGVFDDNHKLLYVDERVNKDAENLIEEFMLIANETVDKTLTVDHDYINLHRVHGKPNLDRINDFIKLLAVTNHEYNKYSPEQIKDDPFALQDLTKYIHTIDSLNTVFSNLLIRCMSKAKYSPKNIGHFGLGKDNYCHFTSPIRRYPDLEVHRMIKDFIVDKNSDTSMLKNKWESKLFDVGDHTSNTERNADAAERAGFYMKVAEYMESHIGEEYYGTIINIGQNSIEVMLDNRMSGIIKLKNLGGKYIFNPDNFTMISISGGDNYYLGDRIKVMVKSASKENKSVEFIPMEKILENRIEDVNHSNQMLIDKYGDKKIRQLKKELRKKS